ncbi:MAG: SDR family NAD(P)-dependent oxidoreductase [Gammaproteobacteria bacterium]|nr:SDR family NAD(P)-dependent oxidoreductase [Gammaproteobacteria bacterium]
MPETLANVQSMAQPWIMATGIIVWSVLALMLLHKIVTVIRERAQLDISGRWIAVTGCDSGFGRGVVEALVARRAMVIACCLTPEGASAALEAGARLAPCLDLKDERAILRAAQEVETACEGGLWGLVHCAGIVLPGFADYQPISFYREVMEVNFFAPVLLTQKLIPGLRKTRGRIVLVSSVDGLVSLPGNAPYDASKFAVEAYADALRAELSFWDVSVSVINPSTMRTPMSMKFFEAHRKAWLEMARIDPAGEWKSMWPREWLEEYIELNTRQLDKISQDPIHAVRDISHALTARRPRLRYLSGTAAKTLFYALWVGPESWALRFKRVMIQPPPPVNPL